MLLLILTVVLALIFQYSLAPAIVGATSTSWNVFKKAGIGKHIYMGWTDGCNQYLTEGDNDKGAFAQCSGNAAVYRPTFFSFLFFVCASVASYLRPPLNREVWPAKYCIYLLLVLASVFMSNHPWFSSVFLHLSRVGAMVFIVIQQVILIDLAYNWNDNWVSKADALDRSEWGSGAKWLRATISVCALLYVLAFVGIGLMYHYFSGCGANTSVIIMTFIGILSVTVIQLSGFEGSLLTSSVISLYVVYLGYSAVSKSPHGCNPQLAKDNNTLDVCIGLSLTALSLAWTGWSYTAEDRLSNDGVKKARSLSKSGNANFRRGEDSLLDLEDPFLEYNDEDRPPAGLALGSDDNDDYILRSHSSDIWKLNAILALVSCWVAMSLTGWGSISEVVQENGMEVHTAANPTIGKINMVMIVFSQWVALILYAWTLLAPRLFPGKSAFCFIL